MDESDLKLKRDCEAIQIPLGHVVNLPAGTLVDITQTLGGNYTVQTAAGLFRIAARDADALGVQSSGSLMEEVCKQPEGPAGPVDEKLVWDTLKTCFDPEIPVNIVDLGLVYDLVIEPAIRCRFWRDDRQVLFGVAAFVSLSMDNARRQHHE